MFVAMDEQDIINEAEIKELPTNDIDKEYELAEAMNEIIDNNLDDKIYGNTNWASARWIVGDVREAELDGTERDRYEDLLNEVEN
jgi:hypothetical protein